MSNIIKGVDFGMGYEEAKERCKGIQAWHGGKWVNIDQHQCIGLNPHGTYRRPLPILANHPEATPLEPGEVLQDGADYLTRSGEVFKCVKKTGDDTYEFGDTSNGPCWTKHGRIWLDDCKSSSDIIARLPKVAKEAEKAKEEKVKNTVTIKTSDDFRFCLGSGTITLGEKDISNLLAEVKRQEEAKRIGPGDWFKLGSSICRCASVEGDIIYSERWDKFAPQSGHRDNCRKIENPTLIAALNAEIDGKAGG